MTDYPSEQAARLRAGVQRAYSAVAEAPTAEHPFAVGRAFAEGLGYPAEWRDRVPAASLEAFTGASNVVAFADLAPGACVLDLGCGAGLDSLIAAGRVGAEGAVRNTRTKNPRVLAAEVRATK